MRDKLKTSSASHSGGNAVYSLGMIGAAVYYLQHAASFWLVLVGLFKALLWPAFLVYEVLASLRL